MTQNAINWLVEDHIIEIKLYHWDSKSLSQLMNNVNDLVNTSELILVHTVWDLTELKSYTTNLNEIRQAIHSLFTNKKLGWVITIIHNPIVMFIAQAGSGMYKARYRRFKSMDEVITFLQLVDSSLPELT